VGLNKNEELSNLRETLNTTVLRDVNFNARNIDNVFQQLQENQMPERKKSHIFNIVLSVIVSCAVLFGIGYFVGGKMGLFPTESIQPEENLFAFNPEELKAEIKNLNVTFEYKLPTKSPFHVDKTQVDKPPFDNNMIMVDIIGLENEQLLTLTITDREVHHNYDRAVESVKVDNLEGTFWVNDNGGKILEWVEEGITYTLAYAGFLSEVDVSKEELIFMAESFQ
jgi:hypothetical protein